MKLTWQDWLTIAGFAIGVLGLAVAYWQWRAQRNESEPYYRLTSHRIIGPFDPSSPFAAVPSSDLALSYGGERIDAANRAFLAIWNQGAKVLEGDSLLREDPLRVELEGDAFFLGEPRVLSFTREAIKFEALRDPAAQNRTVLNFAFLAQGDGALLELLFSGPSQAIFLRGDFKSARAVRRDGDLVLKLGRSKWDFVVWDTMKCVQFCRENKAVAAVVVGYISFVWLVFSVSLGWRSILFYPAIVLTTVVSGLLLTMLSQSGALPSVSPRNRRLPRALRTYHIPPLNAPRTFRALLGWIWTSSKNSD